MGETLKSYRIHPMPDKPYISIVIPVYNEEGNLQPLFDRLFPVMREDRPTLRDHLHR